MASTMTVMGTSTTMPLTARSGTWTRIQTLPVFNTNTLWFRTDALERELPLRWYPVRKDVNGTEVVQFEQLVGQASWFLDSLFTRVPRERFAPVKSPEDLAGIQGALRAMFPDAR